MDEQIEAMPTSCVGYFSFNNKKETISFTKDKQKEAYFYSLFFILFTRKYRFEISREFHENYNRCFTGLNLFNVRSVPPPVIKKKKTVTLLLFILVICCVPLCRVFIIILLTYMHYCSWI
jgi:hypothetical protein